MSTSARYIARLDSDEQRKLERDLIFYNVYFLAVKADGTVSRVDPREVKWIAENTVELPVANDKHLA